VPRASFIFFLIRGNPGQADLVAMKNAHLSVIPKKMSGTLAEHQNFMAT
jgi:hypothetical protein